MAHFNEITAGSKKKTPSSCLSTFSPQTTHCETLQLGSRKSRKSRKSLLTTHPALVLVSLPHPFSTGASSASIDFSFSLPIIILVGILTPLPPRFTEDNSKNLLLLNVDVFLAFNNKQFLEIRVDQIYIYFNNKRYRFFLYFFSSWNTSRMDSGQMRYTAT